MATPMTAPIARGRVMRSTNRLRRGLSVMAAVCQHRRGDQPPDVPRPLHAADRRGGRPRAHRPGLRHPGRPPAPPRPGPVVPEALDAVVISHQHRDHLDMASLRRLEAPVLAPSAASLKRLKQPVIEVRPGDVHRYGDVAVHVSRPPTTAAATSAPQKPPPSATWSTGVRGCTSPATPSSSTGSTRSRRSTTRCCRSGAGGRRSGPATWIRSRRPRPPRACEAGVVVPIHWGTFLPIGLRRRYGNLLRDPADTFVAHMAELAPATRVEILAPGRHARSRLRNVRRPGFTAVKIARRSADRMSDGGAWTTRGRNRASGADGSCARRRPDDGRLRDGRDALRRHDMGAQRPLRAAVDGPDGVRVGGAVRQPAGPADPAGALRRAPVAQLDARADRGHRGRRLRRRRREQPARSDVRRPADVRRALLSAANGDRLRGLRRASPAGSRSPC